jgi:transposase
MDGFLAKRLVSDSLWAAVAPLLPPHRTRSQGGGLRPVDDRAVFVAIAYVLTSGSAWHTLPAAFGVSKATAHRRFAAWTTSGLWDRDVLAAVGAADRDWAAAIWKAASERAADARHGSEPTETAD